MLIFTTMINDVDDRAFMQEVYQQNERLMYAIALKYASNTQDCEDIVHDTVEKLCKNIAKIKGLPNSALRAYVVYAVRNTAINFRKHQSTINRHIQQLSGDDSSSEYDQPESIIERIEDLQEQCFGSNNRRTLRNFSVQQRQYPDAPFTRKAKISKVNERGGYE